MVGTCEDQTRGVDEHAAIAAPEWKPVPIKRRAIFVLWPETDDAGSELGVRFLDIGFELQSLIGGKDTNRIDDLDARFGLTDARAFISGRCTAEAKCGSHGNRDPSQVSCHKRHSHPCWPIQIPAALVHAVILPGVSGQAHQRPASRLVQAAGGRPGIGDLGVPLRYR